MLAIDTNKPRSAWGLASRLGLALFLEHVGTTVELQWNYSQVAVWPEIEWDEIGRNAPPIASYPAEWENSRYLKLPGAVAGYQVAYRSKTQ